jgi:hypothetical protein
MWIQVHLMNFVDERSGVLELPEQELHYGPIATCLSNLGGNPPHLKQVLIEAKNRALSIGNEDSDRERIKNTGFIVS